MPERNLVAGSFSLTWKAVAAGASMLAIASLATLVVVATVRGADLLATIALTLAVITFLIQIASFIGQVLVSAQQTTESRVVFAETKALLGRLESHAAATNQVIGQQYGKLLDKVIAGASATVEAVASTGDEIDVDDLKVRLATDLTEIVEAARESATVGLPPSVRHEIPPADPVAIFRQWPSSHQLEQLGQDRLGDLSPAGQLALHHLADLHISNLRNGESSSSIPLPSDPGVRELVDADLIQRTSDADGSTHSERRYRLTRKGRTALRLFTADGPVPEAATRLIPWLTPHSKSAHTDPPP